MQTWILLLSLSLLAISSPTGIAQEPPAATETTDESATADEVKVAPKVEVDPINSDEEIEARLTSIFQATSWFQDIEVKVDGGVAFLTGQADTDSHRVWSEQTTMNTSDVVAVVNRLTVAEKPIWNFSPAIVSLKELARDATSVLPLVAIAIVIAIIFYYLALFAARLIRWLSRNRIESGLLRQVSGNVIGVAIFIVGVYIALRVSGLTRLAVTLLGGTGLVGLALGFAFRDIAENYLASILISLNNPFRVGDLVEIAGHMGYVRKVTTRGTVLNSVDGNQIQIPNSTVYKGTILNHTATPLTRREFSIGIGIDDSISDAQQLIMDVFNQHTAVVDEPAPVVLVDSLRSATVSLLCQYWLDQEKHAAGKVSSSLIRQVTQRLLEKGVSLPDEARELIFPQGVPVTLLRSDDATSGVPNATPKSIGQTGAVANNMAAIESTQAEGGLSSDRAEIERVTEGDGALADEGNLLKANS